MQNLFNFIIKYSIYFLIFLLPLFFLPFSFEVFEFNKQYLLIFLIGIAFLAWIARMIIHNKELSFRRTPLDIPILIFIGAMILSAVFSIDRASSLLGTYGKFSDSLFVLLSFGALYFLITNNISKIEPQASNTKKIGITVNGILKIFLCSAAGVVLISYFSIIGIWSKIENIIGGEGLPQAMMSKSFNTVGASMESLAMFLLATIVLSAGLLLFQSQKFYSKNGKQNKFRQKKKINSLDRLKTNSTQNQNSLFVLLRETLGAGKFKIFCLFLLFFASVFLLIIIDFTAAWMVLAITLFLFIVFALWKKLFRDRINILLLPIGLIVISVIFSFFNLPESRFTNLSNEIFLSQQASGSIALQAIKERPILGSGIGSFPYNFSKFRNVDFNETEFWQLRFNRSGSYVFELLATGGILGTLGYFLIIIFFLSATIRSNVPIGDIGGFPLAQEKGRQNSAISKEQNKKEIRRIPVMDSKGGRIKKGPVLAMPCEIQEKAENKSPLAIYPIRKSGTSGKVYCLLFVVVALLISQFVYYQNIVLMFLFWLFLGICAVYLARDSKEIKISLKTSPEEALGLNVVFIILAVMFLGLCYFGGRFYLADVAYLESARVKNKLARIASLEKAVNLNPHRSPYSITLSLSYLGYALEEIKKRETDPSSLQNSISKAVEEAKRATQISPNNIACWETMGMIYREIRGLAVGAEKWGVEAFKKAIELEPTNPILRVELGKLYLARINISDESEKQKLEKNAKKEFDKAIELKEDYLDAKVQLALFYEHQGNLKQAISQILNLKFQNPNNSEIIFQLGRLYFNDKQIDKAIIELEETVKLNPSHSNAHYSLALCYQEKGEKNKAIKEFEKVFKLNPWNGDIVSKLEELRKP